MATPELELERNARKLCELFHGRFCMEECRLLVEDKGLEDAVEFVLTGEPEDVQQCLRHLNWTVVQPMRGDAAEIRNLLANGITAEVRQFACAPCDCAWWRKVPVRKEVSKCGMCRVRYDPVPRDKEWGLAEFECQCRKVFRGIAWLGSLAKSPCFRCGEKILPTRILPPRTFQEQQRRRSQHSCTGRNCYQRCSTNAPQGVCIHPRSPGVDRQVQFPSTPHVSTGSTVATFLSQENLVDDIYEVMTLPSIHEDDNDSSD